ncbi:MAG: 30S ribosomal protein S16 [Bacteroidota bacterium]
MLNYFLWFNQTRLQRKGRKKRPFYQIVIADARAPRDGKFIERIGTYNPMTKPATIEIDRDKAYDWVMKGAQPTDTVRAILRFKGVYYKKHLMRGVKKGAMTLEEAEAKYQEWIQAKEEKTAKRVEQAKKELRDAQAKIAGVRVDENNRVILDGAPSKPKGVDPEPEAEAETAEPETPEVEASAEENTASEEAPATETEETPTEE